MLSHSLVSDNVLQSSAPDRAGVPSPGNPPGVGWALVAEPVDRAYGQAGVLVPDPGRPQEQQFRLPADRPAAGEAIVGARAGSESPAGGAVAERAARQSHGGRASRGSRHDLPERAQPAEAPGHARAGQECELLEIRARERAVVAAQVDREAQPAPEREGARELPPVQVRVAGLRVRVTCEDVWTALGRGRG